MVNSKIYVIIVTYKGMQWYDKCFSSLRESTLPVQTIVVDNSPGNEDAEYIRTYYPEITLIKPELNLGFGKGNNLALKYAREHDADYVFLLNQDTWLVDKEMFSKLITISKAHPEFGILSPMHLKADEKTLNMMLEHQNNHTSMAILSDMYKAELNDIYETNYINAAAWLLPRYTLDVVGGFDPIFQHYEEDDDYLNRTRYHKLKIGICPGVKIVHDHQVVQNPFDAKRARYRHEQMLLVQWMDINQPNQVKRYIRYYVRKLPIFLLLGQWKSYKETSKDLLYLISMRKSILSSRFQNMQQSPSWLSFL